MCVFGLCAGLKSRSVDNSSDLSLAHFYIKVFHETVLFTNVFFSPLNAQDLSKESSFNRLKIKRNSFGNLAANIPSLALYPVLRIRVTYPLC